MGLPSIYWRTKHADIIMRITETVGDRAPIPRWALRAAFDDDQWSTVRRCIDELIAFGAIHQTGKYLSPTRDDRTLQLTELGIAWLSRDPPPPHTTDDPDEIHAYFDDVLED